MALLAFENVSFIWPGGAGLHDVCFDVAEGDFVLLSGPSGAGKSTLLRLMIRFEEPQHGRILLRGTPISDIPPMALRRSVAYLPQLSVAGAPSVREALLLPWRFAVASGEQSPDDAALRRALDAVHLQEVPLDHEAAGLSVGQKQRLAFARTLLLKPAMLLLDEPTSALDTENRRAAETLMEQANAAGIAVVLVTHTDYVPGRPCRTLRVHGGAVHETTQETQA